MRYNDFVKQVETPWEPEKAKTFANEKLRCMGSMFLSLYALCMGPLSSR
jgi:hypothetical protein